MYNYFVEELLKNGIKEETLLYSLSIPLIIVILNITRYLVGIKPFKTYTILAIVFFLFEMGKTFGIAGVSNITNGIIYGAGLILAVYGATVFSYNLLHQLKLHYYPKVTTVLIGSILGILFMLFIAQRIGAENILRIDPLSIILLVIIADHLLEVYLKKSLASTFFALGESFMLSSLLYLLIATDLTKEILFKYPYVLIVMIIINILIGRYTGLRLTEITRFYDLLVDKFDNKNEDSADTEE